MHISCTIELPQSAKQQIDTEIALIRADHPEYTWYSPADYKLTLYEWPQVEEDLIPQLAEKIKELTIEVAPFILYGREYKVHISRTIEVRCMIQSDHSYATIGQQLHRFFASPTKQEPHFDAPFIKLAKYKIPSKQQYSHLKNNLERCTCAVEWPVTALTLAQNTIFGQSDRVTKQIMSVPLLEV